MSYFRLLYEVARLVVSYKTCYDQTDRVLTLVMYMIYGLNEELDVGPEQEDEL